MSKFNKATAAVLAGSIVTILASVIELNAETQGAITTLLTAALVWAVPNA